MHNIRLSLTPAGWVARYTDPEIYRLFKTVTLLTTFTANAAPMAVLAEIRRLNPAADVQLDLGD
jgi:hypothetical protein